MPTKKTSTQLQREINESLAERYPYTIGTAGLWRHRVQETRRQIAKERELEKAATGGSKRSHATKINGRKIRYVTLGWFDPKADPTRQHNEGSYRVDTLNDLLIGLYARGITKIGTDDVAIVRAQAPAGMTVESLY